MIILHYALPTGVCERIEKVWDMRPDLPPGMTYNMARNTGTIVVGIPANLEATVVGTCAFGGEGTDIDFGLVGWEVDALPEGVKIVTTIYPKRGVITHCEHREVGRFSFMALPSWRALHDAMEYARAAPMIHALGLERWLAWKKVDKIAAYQWAGITCKIDGMYDL